MSEKPISVREIFAPTSVNLRYTYVSRSTYESEIIAALESGKIAFLYGETKTGKTVLAEHVANKISISTCRVSGNFASFDEFKEDIITQLGLPQKMTSGKKTGRSVDYGTEAEGTIGIFGKLAASVGVGKSREASTESETLIDPFRQLQKNKNLLIVDNFHYIQNIEVQRDILRKLREIVTQKVSSVKVIIIAITNKGDYLRRVQSEMNMRYRSIELKTWTSEDLEKIAKEGFNKLKVNLPQAFTTQYLAIPSLSSPALMQSLCLQFALNMGFLESRVKWRSPRTQEAKPKVFEAYRQVVKDNVMESDYNDLIFRILESTKFKILVSIRANINRNIAEDKVVIGHEAILHSIALSKGRLSFRNLENELNRIIIVNSSQVLPLLEMVIELEEVSQELWEEQLNQTNIDVGKPETKLVTYNRTTNKIEIGDPYFVFYVMWSGYLTDAAETMI